ncbi:MAG TPA: hypothetical protein DIW47_08120 [Bacteroidetes bacterium]|nr:hypothetical protein [Bacteroidota bacterium]
MIQRKQSIYLFIILAVVGSLLAGNPVMYTVSGEDKWTDGHKGTIEVSVLKIDGFLGETLAFETLNSYLIYTLGAVALLAFLALFLYKNRKLQLLLCGFNYLMMAGIGVFMYLYILEGKTSILLQDSSEFHYSFLVAVLLPIMNFLAMRGIFADEKLIRSMDRLR